jgi:hypothetical protein
MVRPCLRAVGVAILLLAANLARGQTPPAPGAVAGFPPPGTTYVIEHRDSAGKTRRLAATVLEDGVFERQPVYRVTDGSTVVVLDKATRNAIATLKDGKLIWRFTPHEGTYAWPMEVGKSWSATYAAEDPVRQRKWHRVEEAWTIAAYEEITVRGGTFRAFRLESTPGENSGVRKTLWYAPEIHLYVKRISERGPNHFQGPGKDTFELVEFVRAR